MLNGDGEIVWGRESLYCHSPAVWRSPPSPPPLPLGAFSHTLILPYAADPLLTELGQDQARDAQAMWKAETESGGPLPDKLYCSPMTRAIQTCQITFEGVLDFAERRPLVLEVSFRFRELKS